jgi:hypothetical protein
LESELKPSDQQEQDNNSVIKKVTPLVISYNFSEGERPGGMKVRAKIRIVSGRPAAVLDAAQAGAILELLTWARQHRLQGREPQDS